MNKQMDIAEFLRIMRRRNVTLRVTGDKLLIDGPQEFVDEQAKEYITLHRGAIVDLLRSNELPTKQAVTTQVAEGTWFPLSYAQLIFWFIHFAVGETANPVSRIVLKGAVDPAEVELALRRIVAKNDALRASISHSSPVQKINRYEGFDLEYADLHIYPLEDRAQLAADRFASFTEAFNLRTGLQIRAILFRLQDHEFELVSVFPHIVLDGAGVVLYEQDVLAELSEANPVDPSVTNIPSKYTLRQFVTEERNLPPQEYERQLDFWRESLAGHEVPTVPYHYIDPGSETHVAQQIVIPENVMMCMQEWCVEERVTFQMCMLGLISRVVGQFCKTNKPLIGSVMENRTKDNLETLYAPMMYTLYVPVQLSQDISFRDVLVQVKEHSRDAFEHMNIPFGAVYGLIERKKWNGLDRIGKGAIEIVNFLFVTFNRKAKLYKSYLADFLYSIEPPISRLKHAFSKHNRRVAVHFNVNMLQNAYKRTDNNMPAGGGARRVSPANDFRFIQQGQGDRESHWEDDVVNFYVTSEGNGETSFRLVCSRLNPAGVTALTELVKNEFSSFDSPHIQQPSCRKRLAPSVG